MRRKRWQWWPLAVIFLTAPFIAFGVISIDSNTDDLAQWLPERQEERRTYQWFVEHFGVDEFVLVSWPECDLQDARLLEFAAALEESAGEAAPPRQPRLIDRVFTGPAAVAELTAPPLELPPAVARTRLRGVLIGDEDSGGIAHTAALVQLTEHGASDQQAVIQCICRVARDACGLMRDELRMGGSAYEKAVVDDESRRSMNRFMLPVGLVTLVICWFAFRNVELIAAVLVAAFYCRFLCVALVYYSGGKLNAVLIIMPALVYVVTVSGAVHLVNYYRDAVRRFGPATAPRRALRAGWLPCTLAIVTTTIGLLSLLVSEIGMIRSFGCYSALGLTTALAVILTFVPAALTLWPLKVVEHATATSPGRPPSMVHRAAEAAQYEVIRHGGLIAAVGVGLVILLGYGLRYTQTQVKLDGMFRPESEINRNYRWLESHVGPLVSVEVVVGFDKRCPLSMVERLQVVSRLESRIRRVPDVGGVISTATFLPTVPRGSGVRQTVQRSVLDQKLALRRQRLLEIGFLAVDSERELWRISVRLPARHEKDFDELVEAVRASTEETIARLPKEETTHLTLTYTGLGPLINLAHRQLLVDLANSFALACGMICPVMILVLRDIRGGLLAMIPNIAPIALVFGGLGWMRVPVDVASVLTASVALGIAVDDTLHFLTWYLRAMQQGSAKDAAIREAYRKCAPAMIQTTLICGLGLLVMSLSRFVPTSRFARLMFVLLSAALIGDLVLLPALLASPLGRFVAHRWSTARPTILN